MLQSIKMNPAPKAARFMRVAPCDRSFGNNPTVFCAWLDIKWAQLIFLRPGENPNDVEARPA